MKLYRFSPITSEQGLLDAIWHTHFACFELCKKYFGNYLPVAGNIGIFCHYDDEYVFLTELRKNITEESDTINQKYFLLHNPIVISTREDIPETTYTYLYIRKPDQYRAQVGDVDFVIDDQKYIELMESLQKDSQRNGVKIFDRPDLDMIELSHPDIDVLAYISTKTTSGRVRVKQV